MRYVLMLGLLVSAHADTITVNGTKTDGVYITESGTRYFVSDFATKKTWSIEKSKATVEYSDDHAELRKRWLEQSKAPILTTTPRGAEVADPREKPITIRSKGDYKSVEPKPYDPQEDPIAITEKLINKLIENGVIYKISHTAGRADVYVDFGHWYDLKVDEKAALALGVRAVYEVKYNCPILIRIFDSKDATRLAIIRSDSSKLEIE